MSMVAMINSSNTTLDSGVEAVGLTKSFGPVAAVRRVDLSIGRGETVALLGPNGAGKSTTLFIVKDAPAEHLADAIRRVAAGERVVDPDSPQQHSPAAPRCSPHASATC
jgi:ATPase subunit of ABC transporter with duplicated ATPase domains